MFIAIFGFGLGYYPVLKGRVTIIPSHHIKIWACWIHFFILYFFGLFLAQMKHQFIAKKKKTYISLLRDTCIVQP
jgi:putative Mn2+ efflux pump MntP